MRKIVSVLLAALLIFSVAPASLIVGAEGVRTSGIWTYEVDHGYAVIRQCSRVEGGKIAVPDTLDGFPVGSWDMMAFVGLRDYEFVIPASFPHNLIEYEKQLGLSDSVILGNINTLYQVHFVGIVANAFTVTEGNPHLASVDGVLYSKDLRTLIKYPFEKKSTFFSLPASVSLVQTVKANTSPFLGWWIEETDECIIDTYPKPKNLTLHISASQMQALYEYYCSLCSDPGEAWEYMALLKIPEIDYSSPDEPFVWTGMLGGVSVVCTDWVSPKHNGKDLIDTIEQVMIGLRGQNPEEEADNNLSVHFKHCDGHGSGSAVTMSISTPSTKVIKYGHTLTLHTQTANLPAGTRINWTASDTCVTIQPSADTLACDVKSVAGGSSTITAELVDQNGNRIYADGHAILSQLTVESRAGIWQKLVYFLKLVFGIKMTIQ